MQKNFLRKMMGRNVLIGVAVVLILYCVLGFWFTPFLVSRLAPKMVAENLQRELRMGPVKINPFLLSLQISDVGLFEQDGTLIVGFERCFVDFELSSIFRWALVFKTFHLEKPRLNMVIDRAGDLNLAKMAAQASTQEEHPATEEEVAEESAPPRLVLQHIQIADGELDVTDQRQSIPAEVAVRPLNIELHDISTLPDRKGPYSLAATTTDGETFEWTGEITLHPFSSTGRLGIHDIQTSSVWQFFRDSLRIDEPQGRFSIETEYALDFGGSDTVVRLNGLQFDLSGLSMTLSQEKQALLDLAQLTIRMPRVDVIEQVVDIESIQFKSGSTAVVMDENNRLNWGKISVPSVEEKPSKAHEPDAQSKTGKPWKIEVADIALLDIQVLYEDSSRKPVLRAVTPDLDGAFKLDMSLGSGTTDLRVSEAWVALNDVKIEDPDASAPEIRIAECRLDGGRYDLGRAELNIQGISFTEGNIRVLRESNGRLNLVDLFVPERSRDEATQSPAENQDETAFQYIVENLAISDFEVSFSDRTVQPEGKIVVLDNLHLAASNIDGKTQMPVDMSFSAQSGGRLEVKTLIDPLEPAVHADIHVEALSLSPFEPYVTPHASLNVPSGAISTSGKFAYRAHEKQPKIAFQGDVDVADLRIITPGSDETLLGWKHFRTSDLKFQLQPDRLEAVDLKLTGLDGQFIISKDGSLNLAEVFKGGADEAAEANAQESEPTEKQTFPVHIHKLRIEDSGLFFADYSLFPQFATRIHQLQGSVTGISSEKGARAQVDLDGRVNEYGLSKIKGEIRTFDPAAYTNMSVVFRNLEMTRLTPYSGKFVGRRIDSGKLSLDLKYLIENSQLKGDNQIVVERIALGERVESSDAVSLPLNLAIALLEDGNGVIDIGLPVSGDLQDPKFSYGQLIWKAFTNLITKIATAPFRALGALLGGGGETLDAIAFEGGSAGILPPEAEKLSKLAEALEKRPNLKLTVQGRYSEAIDGQAIKELQVRRHVATQQGLSMDPGEDPGILDFGNPDIRLALEAVFTHRFGTEEFHAVHMEGEKQPLENSQTTGPSSGEAQVADPDAPWKRLYGRLVDEEPLEPTALTGLAEARAQSVIQALQGEKGLAQDRIAFKPPKALSPGKAPRVKMALEAMQVQEKTKKAN